MPPLPRSGGNVVTAAPPPCTVENLRGISLGLCTLNYPLRDVDAKVAEIVPGIWMGEGPLNPDRLKKRGIVRVLNCAAEKEVLVTNHLQNPYKDHGIRYMALSIPDRVDVNIREHLEPVAKFLDRGLAHKGDGVYVYSINGNSRAAIFVITYLMRRRGMTGVAAMQTVQMRRPISPHDGYLRLIVELDAQRREDAAKMKRLLDMHVGYAKPRPDYAPNVHYRDPEVYRFAATRLHRQKIAQRLYFDSSVEGPNPITHDEAGNVKRLVFSSHLVA